MSSLLSHAQFCQQFLFGTILFFFKLYSIDNTNQVFMNTKSDKMSLRIESEGSEFLEHSLSPLRRERKVHLKAE